MSNAAPAPALPMGRLAVLVRIRALAVLAIGAALAFAVDVGAGSLPYGWILAIVAVYVLANAALWIRSRRDDEGGNLEVFLHLCLDLILLSALLALSGAAANPFVFLLIVSVALAAAMLDGRWAAGVIAVSIACYTALLLVPAGQPISPRLESGDAASLAMLSTLRSAPAAGHHAYVDHLWGMWVAFIVTAVFLGAFVHWIASSLRERQAAFTELEKRQLLDEKMLALGTFAAGAAHELATPLSVIRVATSDLLREAESTPLREPLARIDEQTRVCREILQRLSDTAADPERVFEAPAPLEDIVRQVVRGLRALRPDAAPVIELDHGGGRRVILDGAMRQAVLSILNNAADVSPGDIRIESQWTRSALNLRVLDRGPGMAAEPGGAAGGGVGIGIILARASAERLGGRLEYRHRPGGGTVAEFHVPLKVVLAD